ncbi:MAG: hypothetical protein H7Y03_06965 [Chitinophagaceae bacterium]|nr:hypothetical protein [Chitinophagaceae bacterium]
MIAIFRQKSSGNALILLLYGLVLKFHTFLYPVKPVPNPGDNYIYLGILNFFKPLAEGAPVVFSILAFLILFAEATLLNRIVNSLRLFPKPNYLTAMAYILLSSMMKDWGSFSAPLIVNGCLIWIYYLLQGLHNNNKPKAAIFNVAVLTGILPLIYAPAIAYVSLLLLALFVMRAFSITEILVALLGVITPYYFFFVVLYLTNQWTIDKIVPSFTFYFPKMPSSLWITGGITLLMVPFLMGGYFVQGNLNKMLIQVRKSWSLLLLMLVVSLLVILINPGYNYLPWMVVIVPLAAFHAATYFYLPSKWGGHLLHWVSFAFVIMLNYRII